ncbi:acetyltransferase [Advenella kashmirensis WT001]|uniref:Acetyltransferase n=1 Tax=Advenella kashmirensis (strain DSM 17095 / LMG 22695 / WT001) TaxID=1036672 RepID=I3UDH2_ADVKW|nr:acetyltransferase [Advenella kashmirensis WT001]
MEHQQPDTPRNANNAQATVLRVDNWDALKDHAAMVRHEVFVMEQQVPPELEMDEMDVQCIHAVAYDAQQRPVATGRLLPDGHIGRMAVRKIARGTGIGGLVLQRLIEAARVRGDAEVVLSARFMPWGFMRVTVSWPKAKSIWMPVYPIAQ